MMSGIDIDEIFREVWTLMRVAYSWPRHRLTRWTASPRGRTLYLPLPRSWLAGGSDPRPPTTHTLIRRTHTLMNIKRSLAVPAFATAVIAAGLSLGVALPTPSPSPAPSHTIAMDCEEDQPCWVCSPEDDACADPTAGEAWKQWELQGGVSKLKVDCGGGFRVDYMGATPHYPQNTDALDLVLAGRGDTWYVFRAACLGTI